MLRGLRVPVASIGCDLSCGKWGLIARSPAVDATPPSQRRREITPPTVAQVRDLLEAARAEDPEFGAYVWVLAATGCRRGEGCALRWSDVDVDRGDLVIRRSIAMANGAWRPDVCTNCFGQLRATLGLSDVRLHDLRHFVATVLGDGGPPIATISSRLGHRDTATTLNIYTHAIPASDQQAAIYLGNLLAVDAPTSFTRT